MVRMYKIRQLTTKHPTGNTSGIAIPKNLVWRFDEVYFNIVASGNNIVLMSGAKSGGGDFELSYC